MRVALEADEAEEKSSKIAVNLGVLHSPNNKASASMNSFSSYSAVPSSAPSESFVPPSPLPLGSAPRSLTGDDEFHSLLEADRQEATFCRQFSALFVKRWHNIKRDKKAFMCQLLLPLILLTLGLGLLRIPTEIDFYNLLLSPEVYNTPLPVPVNNFTTNNGFLPGATPSVFSINSSPLITHAQFSISPQPFGTSVQDLASFSATLLKTRDNLAMSRYGAIVLNSSQPDGSQLRLDAIYSNNSALYGLATFFNFGNNVVLRAANPSSPKAAIVTRIHPFSLTRREKWFVQNLNGAFAAIVIAISYSFIPASYAVYVVKERESNSKHLQLLSGVNPLAYWTQNFAFDFLCFLVPAFVGVFIIWIFNNPNLTGDNFHTVGLSFILYGLSVIPFTYCLSFAFRSHSTAQNVMIIVYLVAGVVLLITCFALYTIPKTRDANDKYVRYIFRLFPNFCLSDSIFFLSARGFLGQGQWDMKISGWDLVFMSWESVFYFAITLILEYITSSPAWMAWFQSDPVVADPVSCEDDDVMAERARLQAGASDIIQLQGLRKTFAPDKVAVKDLWFGVPINQCLGFLGTNLM